MPKLSQKGIAHLFLLVIIVAAIALGIYLVQTRTNLLPQAANEVTGPETSFSLQSDKKSVKVGEEFKVNVMVSSDFDAANLFSALISYPADKLEVVWIEPTTSGATPSAFLDSEWSGSSGKEGLLSKLLSQLTPKVEAQTSAPMPTIVGKTYCSNGKPVAELNWTKVQTSDLEYLIFRTPDPFSGVTVSTLYDRYQYPIKDTGFISPIKLGTTYTYHLESFGGLKSNSVTVTTPANCTNATPTPTPAPACGTICINGDKDCAGAKDGCTSCVSLKCQPPAKPSVTPTPNPPKPSITPVPTGIVVSPPPVNSYFIKKWIEQTNDKKGTLSLVGAVPNPGFKTEKGQKGIMVTITFRAKANGEVNLDFVKDVTAIYRNSDNQNILTATRGLKLTIGGTASPTPPPVYPGKMYLKAGSDKVSPACTVPVVIALDTGGRNMDGADAILRFDPKVLTVNSINDGVLAEYPPKGIDNEKGLVSVSGLAPVQGPGFSGAGILATVNFQVKPNALQGVKTEIIFDYDPNNPGRTTDSNMVKRGTIADILGSVTNASFLIDKSGVCLTTPSPTPTPLPPSVDGKRADLYKDSKKPNFVNDQDISVFFTKCSEKGVELFGKPASLQPICDILKDEQINVSDWAVLVKFRNKSV